MHGPKERRVPKQNSNPKSPHTIEGPGGGEGEA